MEPIDRATVWPYDEHGEPGEFVYQRYAHPTGAAAERALGRLEGGDALLYASGTSAVTACVFAFCRPGMTVALAEGAYFGTGVTLGQFAPWGLKVVEFDQTGPPPAGADVLWLEAPANPLLTLPDWEAVRAHPAFVVCDATVATPVFLHALDEGADVALHSATKYLTGHHNAMLGATVTRDPRRRRRRSTTPGCASASPPHRMRLPRCCTGWRRSSSACAVRPRPRASSRRRLEAHPAVLRVRYPGFGGLIAFDVADDDAREVETATTLIANQTSLGGVASSMESRWRWEGDRIPRGLLRLSVGLEDVDEIWADLAAALDR